MCVFSVMSRKDTLLRRNVTHQYTICVVSMTSALLLCLLLCDGGRNSWRAGKMVWRRCGCLCNYHSSTLKENRQGKTRWEGLGWMEFCKSFSANSSYRSVTCDHVLRVALHSSSPLNRDSQDDCRSSDPWLQNNNNNKKKACESNLVNSKQNVAHKHASNGKATNRRRKAVIDASLYN